MIKELSSLFCQSSLPVLLLNSLKGFTNFFVFGTIFDCKIRLLHVRVVNDFMGNYHFSNVNIIAVGNDVQCMYIVQLQYSHLIFLIVHLKSVRSLHNLPSGSAKSATTQFLFY